MSSIWMLGLSICLDTLSFAGYFWLRLSQPPSFGILSEIICVLPLHPLNNKK